MAMVEYRLAAREQKPTGRHEVLLRFYNGTRFNLRAKTGVFCNPDFFEYYIDIKKTLKAGIAVRGNAKSATEAVAVRMGYALRGSGEIVIRQRMETPDTAYHRELKARMAQLERRILDDYAEVGDGGVSSDWLQEEVDTFLHPDIRRAKAKTFYELGEEYLRMRKIAASDAKNYRVLLRTVARFEGFLRGTDRKGFHFDIDKVTRDDIENFADYLRNEKSLSEEYPRLFDTLIHTYPASLHKSHTRLSDHGENTVIKNMKRLKSLFLWFFENGMTHNRPFDGIEIGTEQYGTPYYITISERNKIAETEIADETLAVQRDIFVFHCFVGCRVSDLVKLTNKNVTDDGVLVYTPHKTKDGSQSFQARVPLHPKALALMKKYEGVDGKGRLFPFISAQKYNQAIKVIFTLCGITRSVEVRNPRTGEIEMRPINEIASSHLARRTFVGNAYFKVSDPNIIGKMSGHVDGSRAFKRYRKIEDDTLRNVIDQIG